MNTKKAAFTTHSTTNFGCRKEKDMLYAIKAIEPIGNMEKLGGEMVRGSRKY
jgi:hypothetical protein